MNISDNWIPLALIVAILFYNVAELFAPAKNCPAPAVQVETVKP